MLVNISQISETNYTEEMPIGLVEIESIEALAAKVDGIIDGKTIVCEWPNGEGQDVYEIELVS